MAERIETAHRIRRVRSGEELQLEGLLPLGLASGGWQGEDEALMFVAEVGTRRMALCTVQPVDRQVACIKDLWVAPTYRSRGILKHLLRRVMQQLKALGYRELVARTANDEPSLSRMLGALGLSVYAVEGENAKTVRRWRGNLAAVA